MKVFVLFEESAKVRDAFRARGHGAAVGMTHTTLGAIRGFFIFLAMTDFFPVVERVMTAL